MGKKLNQVKKKDFLGDFLSAGSPTPVALCACVQATSQHKIARAAVKIKKKKNEWMKIEILFLLLNKSKDQNGFQSVVVENWVFSNISWTVKI